MKIDVQLHVNLVSTETDIEVKWSEKCNFGLSMYSCLQRNLKDVHKSIIAITSIKIKYFRLIPKKKRITTKIL